VWLEASFGRVEAWFFSGGKTEGAEGADGAERPERAEGAKGAGRVAGGVPRPTIIFAHGNGELIEDWQGDMKLLAAAGPNAFVVEFPGYGHSQGKPSRSTLRETFTLAFDWLVARDDIDADRIVAHGRSLGGAVAGDLALDRPVRALVFQSTFSSASAIARENFVPGFLVRDRFDNRRAVSDFSGPVLLMHGIRDDVIPYAHAEALAAAREGLDITELDCAHNDCAPQWPEIVASLTAFLRSNALLDR
jgi:pimeloyl-ACP methyl ester carboxylesterase